MTLGHDVTDDAARGSVVRAHGPGDLATLIYTSGTTGRPKGCMLTHGNFMFELTVAVDELDELFAPGRGRARAAVDPAVPAARARLRPDHPGRLRQGARADGALRRHQEPARRLRRVPADLHPGRAAGLREGVQHRLPAGRRRRPGQDLRPGRRRGHRLVPRAREREDQPAPCAPSTASSTGWSTRKLRAALGGRCAYAVSGGAPLGERLGHFYRGIGVNVLEGYGLTETTAALTANLPDAQKVGTVGRPLQGTSVRVADDGELLFRGGQVFAGYWHNDEATAEAKDAKGWFHTGDVGEIDDEGFVRITGRKKEILVTAGGKNVAPAVLEDRLRAHALVDQCIVVGDGRPFIAALVTLDPETLPDVGRAATASPADVSRPRRRPRPACGDRGRRRGGQQGRLQGRVDPQVRDRARRLDRGGRPADPQPEAQARRGHARAPRRRGRPLRALSAHWYRTGTPLHACHVTESSNTDSAYKTDSLRQSVSCRETASRLAVPTGDVGIAIALPHALDRSPFMDRRKVLLVVAAVIAALGTLLVFLYVRGADTRADQRYDAVQVLRVVKQIDRGRDRRGRPGGRQDRDQLGLARRTCSPTR